MSSPPRFIYDTHFIPTKYYVLSLMFENNILNHKFMLITIVVFFAPQLQLNSSYLSSGKWNC